ncbi:MAG: UDP-N-acetylmuramate dehydrogenase [Clostridia bacterium]|nr:UDP-N-acetylmuramate dehydrogenase [Clostridia bacterium]
MRILENESMAIYSSFRIGGNAKRVCFPETREELVSLIRELRTNGEKYAVFGNCSNVLFPDEGYDGTLILTTDLVDVLVYGNVIVADCGATMNKLSIVASRNSLKGMECLYGIPGTVGGGIAMNAGAYGGTISDYIIGVSVLTDEGEIKELSKEDMEFEYRNTVALKKGYIVLGGRFMLEEGNEEEIRQLMDKNMNSRKTKQPLSYPSAGSFFKRPEGYFAGALIEGAGLKGYRIGGAQVSELHAGFIINVGDATAKDVKRLSEYVVRHVKKEFGVTLEREVRFFGID